MCNHLGWAGRQVGRQASTQTGRQTGGWIMEVWVKGGIASLLKRGPNPHKYSDVLINLLIREEATVR